jgi:hypothetical protein
VVGWCLVFGFVAGALAFGRPSSKWESSFDSSKLHENIKTNWRAAAGQASYF